MNYAYTHELEIFPILAIGDEKTAVPFGSNAAQWVDIRNKTDFEPGMESLSETIFKHLGIKSPAQQKAREAAERALELERQAKIESDRLAELEQVAKKEADQLALLAQQRKENDRLAEEIRQHEAREKARREAIARAIRKLLVLGAATFVIAVVLVVLPQLFGSPPPSTPPVVSPTPNSPPTPTAPSVQQILTFKAYDNVENYEVMSVAFSPDGKYVLTGSRNSVAKMFDVESGQPVRTFEGRNMSDATFSP